MNLTMKSIPKSVRAANADCSPLHSELVRFEPFDLTELQDAALLDRVDTKYIIGLHQLYAILPNVERDYRVLTIHTARLHAYQTLYFDTRDFTIYRQHHNGVASRYKVRARRYLDSDLAFLEVKHHTNRKRTVKTRLPIPDIETRLRGQSMEFIVEHTPFDPRELEPKLWNHYTRITLVSRHRPERVTIDTNVEFGWRDDCTMLPGLVIVEVKQARLSQDSEFIQHMRRLGIRPMSYSKYTAGVYSLYMPMKLNNFKAQIRQVNKIMQGEFKREFAY